MNLNSFVKVSLAVVLLAAECANGQNTTTNATNKVLTTTAAKPNAMNTTTKVLTTTAAKPNATNSTSAPALSTKSIKQNTITPKTTTPKPIRCKVMNCSGDSDCFNTTDPSINSIPCSYPESCAVTETVLNDTYSNYMVSCTGVEKCDELESNGKGACCQEDNCIPDLVNIKAKYNALNNNNGCDGRHLNLNFIIGMIIMLLTIM